jgi:hypothetical protein
LIPSFPSGGRTSFTVTVRVKERIPILSSTLIFYFLRYLDSLGYFFTAHFWSTYHWLWHFLWCCRVVEDFFTATVRTK